MALDLAYEYVPGTRIIAEVERRELDNWIVDNGLELSELLESSEEVEQPFLPKDINTDDTLAEDEADNDNDDDVTT